MGTEDVVTTQIPTEEDIATEAIRRAVGAKGSNASQLVLPFVNTVVVEPSPDYCQVNIPSFIPVSYTPTYCDHILCRRKGATSMFCSW